MSDSDFGPQQARYSVRRLEEGDLAAVAAFEVEIAKISFPDDPIIDPEFHRQRLKKSVDRDGAFVAVELSSGQVVGWALVASRENYSSKERYADFKSLFIAPEHRGGALVFHCMAAVEDFAERNGLVRITGRTAAANEGMKAVYERCGYKAVHIAYERSLRPVRRAPASPLSPNSGDGRGGLRRRGGKSDHRKRGNRRS